MSIFHDQKDYLSMITLRQLQVFAEVVRCQGSVTQAASRLYVSQPAVSDTIRALEKTLGARMFSGRGRARSLTPAGDTYWKYTQKILGLLAEAGQAVADLSEHPAGRLSIVAVPTAGEYLIPGLLRRFTDRYPGVALTLLVANRVDATEVLRSGAADLAIMGRPPTGLPAETHVFGPNPLSLVCSPDSPFSEASPSLEEVAASTFLVREQGSGTRAAIEQVFSSAGLSLLQPMVLGSNAAVIAAVREGLGLAVVPEIAIADFLKSGSLVKINTQHFPLHREWHVVWLTNRSRSTPARAFTDLLLEHFKNNNPT